MQSSEIILRPHHGLCIGFFKGNGYNEKFTEHMSSVIEMLRRNDPVITFLCSCDVICSHCPNAGGKICSCEEKVSLYDRIVLSFIGAREGGSMRWSRFFAAVRAKIVEAHRLGEICSDCQWQYICSKKCPAEL